MSHTDYKNARPSLAYRLLIGAGCMALLSGCAGAHLPDAASSDGQLYAARCGACHSPAHPKRHKAASWPRMVELMEMRMAERGHPPLTDRERETILGYLSRNGR